MGGWLFTAGSTVDDRFCRFTYGIKSVYLPLIFIYCCLSISGCSTHKEARFSDRVYLPARASLGKIPEDCLTGKRMKTRKKDGSGV